MISQAVQDIDIHKTLKQFFGYDFFRGKQESVIRHLLNGGDCFVVMPTGAGKSLCYQLPAVMKPGTALVISPLIALMKNQVDQMQALGIEAGFLNSTMSKSEYELVKEKVISRQLKLLYVAPESLVKEEFVEFLRQADISFVAVDEAHCISEWGHDFRPEYRRIRSIINIVKRVPIIALTATATPKVQQDIVNNLSLENSETFISSFNRPNLYYEIRPKRDPVTDIIRYIKSNHNKSGIIYCLSRRKVEELSEILTVNGIKAAPYHAGLETSVRNQHQDMFLSEEIQVVVATIAFGMGIDKPDVRFVIHYDVPKSIESYYQETGRSGRDGLEGNCLLFYDFNDIVKLEKFMKDKGVSERESQKHLLYEMAGFCESGICRRKLILHYFGEFYDEKHCEEMCDNCRSPKQRFDASDLVKHALGCVQETNGKFQMNHLISLLRGSQGQQIKMHHHDKLKSHGKGAHLDELEWKSIFTQLIVLDYLVKDIEDYGCIKLGKHGKEFLEHPTPISLIKFENTVIQNSSDITHIEDVKSYDEILFEMLKNLRKKIAHDKKVPPYIVFQDPSLEDMAIKYPITLEEFENIVGVGAGKARKFATPFLELIQKYVEENDISRPNDFIVKTKGDNSSNKLFIIQHIDRKTPIDQIATLRGMTLAEVIAEIENIIYSGTRLNIDYYIRQIIEPDRIEEVYNYFRHAEDGSIDIAVEEFDDEYDPEELQLVRIKFYSEMAN
ncbi:MAG: DNA helicase RecQ [Bacteroidia bacterium]|nr:DNA helicase RecQ [Bacteroidia bacterium]